MSVDLTTRYLGIKLRSPVAVSSCPITGDLDGLRRLEAAGAAAAVLPSLFEEQIEHEEKEVRRLYEHHSDSHAESLSFFPELRDYNTGSESYLRQLESAKKAVSIPILGSLNGSSSGGWIRYARLMQEAGADALELNVYFLPTDPGVAAADIEKRYLDLVSAVRGSIKIPLAVKIGPNFTCLPHFAQSLVQAGADGLVLFNRWLEPDIDLETLQANPSLVLSMRHELRVPLRWIAILRDQVSISLAATGGVHFAEDVVKALLVGADVAMVASALMRYGPGCVQKLLDELTNWLTQRQYESVSQLKGAVSRSKSPDPGAYERANYMKALVSFAEKDVWKY
jgi:dihydroorotate dehydrogenase (fumarate)